MNQLVQDPVRQKAVEKIREVLAVWDADPMAETSIHQLRVCTKRLRAYLRVYPKNLEIDNANRELKSLADSYAGLRDAQVSWKTLNNLISQWPDKKRHKHREVIDFVAHQKRAMEHEVTPQEPHQALEQVLRSWPRAHQSGEGDTITAEGMDRLYQKACRLGEKALQSDRDDDFHRWRKWVKYWLYCLTGLAEGNLPAGYKKRLKRLGDSLGVFHDICVLEENLKSPDVYHELGKQLKPFYKAIYQEKKRMKKSYKKAFRKLFRLSRKQRDAIVNAA